MLIKLLDNILQENGKEIKGVIHVGAHHGEELNKYVRLPHVIMFEPNPECFKILKQNVKGFGIEETCKIVNKALGNFVGEHEMFADPTGLAGSLLEPVIAKDMPGLDFTEEFTVEVSRLDDEVPEEHPYNFLNMDTQGYELEVLKGGTKVLKNIEMVYTEINRAEIYKDCAKIEQMDEFLEEHGFRKIKEVWKCQQDWGDALYIK